MTDELLPYYEKELAFIRQLGSAFSNEHPKIANRLGMNNDTIEDPHVSRLIESFAYLNARIQHKLDDDFPEISDAMLNVLFPHYQRPIPSMSIMQFVPDPSQLDAALTIPHDTLIETESFQGETCQFSCSYDTELLPIEVTSASVMGRPFATPYSESVRGAQSVLKIRLNTLTEDLAFSELLPDSIRFYLKGQPQHIHPLYEMLLNDCLEVVLVKNESDTQCQVLGKDTIQPVGFKENEGLLPYPASSFLGYRLLTEYFVFPEKFMFVDFSYLSKFLENIDSTSVELYIYLGKSDIELEHNINEQTFALGCTPVVNLFEHTAEPIKLDHTRMEYQIIPDNRRPLGYEIIAINQVNGVTSSGEKREFHPFYGLNHEQQKSDNNAFWFANRRSAKFNTEQRDEGSDVFLNLVDLKFNPHLPLEYTLTISTTCSNRDLPSKLPYNLEHPKLQCVDAAPPCSKIHFLSKPTNTIRAPMRDHARWRLISHLNLNFLSLTGRDDATNALKEILRLYDFKNSPATNAIISSLLNVQAKPISAPLIVHERVAICRGVEIEVELDEMSMTGSSCYLLTLVLEHFFSLYCSINSFTRLLVKIKGKEGYLKKCPPRAGQKTFL